MLSLPPLERNIERTSKLRINKENKEFKRKSLNILKKEARSKREEYFLVNLIYLI
jgi:hypothetical protein